MQRLYAQSEQAFIQINGAYSSLNLELSDQDRITQQDNPGVGLLVEVSETVAIRLEAIGQHYRRSAQEPREITHYIAFAADVGPQ